MRFDERKLIYEDVRTEAYHDLRAFRPDVVFAVLGPPAFDLLRLVPPGVLRAGMVHDHFEPVYGLLRDHASCMDVIAAVSRKTWKHSREILPAIPAGYLAHGIRLDPDRPRRIPNPDRPLRLLYFGRFDEGQKQVSMFPKIVGELERRGVPFSWTFHGYGEDEEPLRAALRQQIASGSVVFSLPVDHGEVPDIIAAHDVYLLASTHEAGPLTLLEAMGCGLVPVCGDIPCLVDEVIRDGKNGFRVALLHPAAYADAIQKMHENRNLLEHLSAAAEATITSEYSSEAMARRYIDFVNNHGEGGLEGLVRWPEKISENSPLLIKAAHHPSLRPLRRWAKRIRAGAKG